MACFAVACASGMPGDVDDDPGSAPPTPGSVEEVLEALGVSTAQTPRVGADGAPLSEDYSPLGTRPYGFKLDELLVAGVRVSGGAETIGLFDGVAEERSATGELETPFRFDSIALPGADWDSMDNPRVTVRGAAGADVDGDGRDELVSVHQRFADDLLYAVVQDDQDGGFEPTDPMLLSDRPLESLSQIEAIAADVDADGVHEVVVAATQAATSEDASAVTLWLLDPTPDGGLEIDAAWTMEIEAGEDWGALSVGLAAGNLDDDNHEEVALVVNELFRTTESIARVHIFDSNPDGRDALDPRPIDVSVGLDNLRVRIGDAAIGDVDGDGRPELVLGGPINVNTGCTEDPYVAVGAFHLNGDALTPAIDSGALISPNLSCDSPGPLEIRAAFIHTLDADGDGVLEVAANQAVVDYDAETGEWTELGRLAEASFHPGDTSVYTLDRGNTEVSVGDVTGDGKDDVVYVTENAREIAVWGSQVMDDGSIEYGTVARIPVDDVEDPILLPINVDGDSYALQYSPSESQLIFTEPVVIAALAAAPCHASGQNTDACVTSFGQAESSGSEQEWSVTLSASVIVGLSSGVDVPFVKVEADTKHTFSVALSYTGSHAYNLERSVTYTTGALEDTVVFTSVPYDMYTYVILDHPDAEQVGSRVAYFVPREPVTLQVERSFYNENVVGDGVEISDGIFGHTIGDPWSYPTAADRDDLMSRHGGMQTEAQSVGQGDGQVEVGLDVSEEWSHGGSLEIGYEFSAEATAATFIAGYSVGVSGSASLSWTTGSSTSFHGAVGNLGADAFATDRYSFGLMTYPMSMNGQEFHVLNYWVEE